MLKLIKQFLIKYKLKKSFDVSFGFKSSVSLSCSFEGKNVIGANTSFMNSTIGLASYISVNCKLNKIKIGRFCSLGQNIVNDVGRHPSSVFVSTHPCFFSVNKQAGFTFSKKTLFEEHLYVDVEKKYYVEIGNDVWIGNNVTLFDGIKIGDGAIIASGAIVTKDVEPYSIVGGIPAKLIRMRFTEEQIESLKKIKWWQNDFKWIKENSTFFSDINKFIQFIK
ncbi:CatB-related O-acetyltransferase [bacterium]|nr:CatB-related O-acetyltransferase [bacterium]